MLEELLSFRKSFFLLFIIISFLILFSAPLVSAATTRYVVNTSNDVGNCSVTPCKTIQYAINQAFDGDTIDVAAGTYDEQVVIDRKLTLQGAGDTTIIQPSASDKLTDVYTYPAGFAYYSGVKISGIITVKNTVGTGVTIKDLKVDGISVTSLPAGADRLAGILYGESAGKIQNVVVNNIKTVGYADRTYGIDLSAAVNTVSVEVSNCQITDFARNGIMGNGPKLTVNIHDNTITGPAAAIGPENVPNGIVFMAELGGSASKNTIHSLHYNVPNSWRSVGIMGFDTLQPGVVFENNEVYDVDDAINPSTGTIIRNNNLHNNGNGVVLEMAAIDNHVINNGITNNEHGIQINGALNPNPEGQDPPGTGNFVHNNKISGNTVGIVSYDSTQTFDAENNWWGSNSGPGPVGPGTGDKVSTNVDYDPWLTLDLTLTSPENKTYNTTSILINTSTSLKADRIEYSDNDPIFRRLCSNCNSYSRKKF